MKTLEDIRQDKDLQSQIRWDMKPRERYRRTGAETLEEMDRIQKEMQARVGHYFYIDVRYQQAALYLYENYPDGSGKFVAEITEIPEQMLREAVEEAGADLEKDGRYPINDPIKTWLKSRLAE